MTDRDIVCEVCVESPEGARAAMAGGADRLELCQDLDAGGLTPSHGLVRAVRAMTRLPIVAMVRPRGGDFAFGESDLEGMLLDAAHLRELGVDGIVTGVLTLDGDLEAGAMTRLVDAAGGLPVTLHRALDMSRNPLAALDAAVAVGCSRVLTSGAARSAPAGAEMIRRLADHAGDRIAVIAGGGVRAENVAELIRDTGVREVHFSASGVVDGPMRHRNSACAMGVAGRDEYERRVTDEAKVRATVRAARGAR